MRDKNGPRINLKVWVTVAVVVMLVIVGISVYFIVDRTMHNVSVRFMVAPASARIILGDEEYKSGVFYKMIPGEYQLVIEKEGFEPYRGVVTLTENDTVELTYALEVLPGNESYYREHPEESYAYETIWTDEMIVGSDIVMQNNPLLKVLPIDVEYYMQGHQYIHYQISFRINEPEDVVILIRDFTGDNYEAALTRIRTEGYNPDDYKIEYQNLKAENEGTENF